MDKTLKTMDSSTKYARLKGQRKCLNEKRLALYRTKRAIIKGYSNSSNMGLENFGTLPNIVTNIPCYDESVFIGKHK